mgnify:CR=1 FL=1
MCTTKPIPAHKLRMGTELPFIVLLLKQQTPRQNPPRRLLFYSPIILSCAISFAVIELIRMYTQEVTMIILGIDPGFAIVGFGVLEAAPGRQRLIRCGAITTPAGLPLPARLLQISDDMATLLRQFKPDAMAVEELFFNQNVTTGISVAQARGVILTEAERACVPIFEYSPSQVKQAVVGYGKAEKRQVMDMTRRLLGLKDVPKPDDAADAVAIALCHARSASSRLSLLDSARPGSGRYAVRDNRR